MGDFGELAEMEVLLYRCVLGVPGTSRAAVAAQCGRGPDEFDKSVARLAEMGLLRVDGYRLTAVSPMLAEATVLGAEDLELGARRAALEQRRDAIRRLV